MLARPSPQHRAGIDKEKRADRMDGRMRLGAAHPIRPGLAQRRAGEITEGVLRANRVAPQGYLAMSGQIVDATIVAAPPRFKV